MDLTITLQTNITVDSEDVDIAEALAKFEAIKIINTIRFRTGMKMKYAGCSFKPELDKQIDRIVDNSKKMLEALHELQTK